MYSPSKVSYAPGGITAKNERVPGASAGASLADESPRPEIHFDVSDEREAPNKRKSPTFTGISSATPRAGSQPATRHANEVFAGESPHTSVVARCHL